MNFLCSRRLTKGVCFASLPGSMNTKIIDIGFVTLNIPVMSDEHSLWRQFQGRTCGNDDDLKATEELLRSYTKYSAASVKTVVVDSGMMGDLPEIITVSACRSIGIDPNSLAVLSFAQIGLLASFFQEEEGVKRMIPVTMHGKTFGLVWERANWPTRKQPVFRFHHKDKDVVHNHTHVMLPMPCA